MGRRPEVPVLLVVGATARGEVEVRNRSDQAISQRRAAVCDCDIGGLERDARVRGCVAAGETGRLKVSLRLPGRVAAGSYGARLALGDQEVPVRILVPEVRTLHAEPRRVVVEKKPGGRVTAPIAIQNTGNVPVEVCQPVPQLLEGSGRNCRVIRRALAVHEPGELAFSDAVATALNEELGSEQLLKARIEGAPFVLEPGNVHETSVRFTVPSKLGRGRSYRASLRVGTAKVRIEIHTQ